MQWIAALQGRGSRREARGEFRGNGLFDDEALGCQAYLSAIGETRAYAGGDRGIQVGIGEHDEGIRSAQLQHRLLAGRASLCGHRGAGARTAGYRDGGHSTVGDDGADRRDRHVQVLEHAGGQTGGLQQFGDQRGAALHIGRVLQQEGIACHQGGGGARKICHTGKFHGRMDSTTPSGRCAT